MSEKPIRGRELLLYINRKKARGVLSLSIERNTERHPLKEYLCEQPYDTPVIRETYRITLTSLLPLKVREKDMFAITVFDREEEVRYEDCTIAQKKEEITPDEYTKFTYLIESTRRRKGGGSCGV
ncbi:MAG: hypothetical protein IJH32_06310 [Ruminococcus sp.]|nr:hypothetical protein [Ruminococcus sp.]